MKLRETRGLVPVLLLALALLGALGCGRRVARVGNTGWKSISPEADTVTLRLERGFASREETETLKNMSGRLSLLATAQPENESLRLRDLYWRLRVKFREEDTTGRGALMAKAMAIADSASYPYEYRRLRWLTYPDDYGFSIGYYGDVSDDANYYHKVGDLLYEADAYMSIGSILQNIGDYKRAADSYSRADSLLHLGGYDNIRSYNRINHANVLFNLKRPAEGAELLRLMLTDTVFPPDTFSECMALGNLYSWVGDTVSLRKAYELVRDNGYFPDVEALYESFQADELIAHGHKAEALRISRKAISHDPCIYGWENGPGIWRSHAVILHANGLTDSAYIYQHRADSMERAIVKRTRAEEIVNADLQQRVNEFEREITEKHRARYYWLGAVIFILLLSSSLIVWLLWRRMRRHSEHEKKLELARRQADKHLLALQLTMQEHDTLLSEMGKEVVQLTKEGEITGAAGQKLESSLKLHKQSGSEREAFVETYSKLHPDFNVKLRERYPNLSDSDLKLAGYIAADIDNRQIARILGIRPESVKQARWRLRNKMNLLRNQDLKEAILTCVNE